MPSGRLSKRPGDLGESPQESFPGTSKVKLPRLERGPEDFSQVVKDKLQSYTRTGQACDRCKVRRRYCPAPLNSFARGDAPLLWDFKWVDLFSAPHSISIHASWNRDVSIIVHPMSSETGSAVRNNFVPVKNDHANARVDHLVKAKSLKGPGALKPSAMPTVLQADFPCGCVKSRFEKSAVMASPKDALPAPSRTSNAMSPTASPGAQNAAAICNSLSARRRT